MSSHLTPRMNPWKASPAAYKPLLELQAYTDKCGLEHSLLELVKTRASQINGCAFCLEMHTREARAAGESEARLYLLNAWHESPLYTDRERAALEWTEAVTLISETGIPDTAWEAVRKEFSDQEIVDLTVAIGMINVWNRLAVGFRTLHPVTEEQQRKAG
ncbi:alkylhydroperoxidase like protein, AhpD family [Parvibaculum lavamentivorans DS-1]|uniref:Alkylhydroperoxidase like protein, AhpD family n=1 Tax=Parvibaculum lavamentivorans (strain DS-1 / DSM 13023 / NCIMB 13966) TaxID=402881 RepID=A7HPC3_PARL1|nr:carboxymuconolactone decarboxylase family protein [Parvibaculum lavamentivorans]ABS61756.1 alkylhydroperoxidase like protein, AhpD family [Parvibaculum lavamentivorans DS-1]